MGFHESQEQTQQSNKMKQKHKDKKHKRSNKQPLLIVGSTSLDGGEGGGVMTLSGGLGPAPPFFLFLEAPECFFFKTAGDFLFVVSLKAWCHFAICNDAQMVPEFILEDITMALV